MKRTPALLAGCLATVAVLAASGLHATPYDNFVLLADAFRHGRVWIDWPGAYIDALRYAGHYYVIEAPLPAVLLLPAVAVLGTAVNQTVLAAMLTGAAIFAAWEIARRLGAAPVTCAILCGFLLLGTDLFWCAMLGDVWFIAHVSAVAFTLLALLELLGTRPRGWLVAILAASAVESRFAFVLALPAYAALLYFGAGLPPGCLESAGFRESAESGESAGSAGNTASAQSLLTSTERRRTLRSFTLGLLPFVALWIGYNELRWNLPYDIGYTAWYHQDSAGEPAGSPFRLSYIPEQLYSFFVRAPDRIAGYPYLVPSLAGVALTWTSPALVLAFFARRPLRLIVAMWAATLLCAAPSLVYYVNGYAQFGMRHALDFEPYLFVLMALAVRGGIGPLPAALCGYSILAGVWGAWYWRSFLRH